MLVKLGDGGVTAAPPGKTNVLNSNVSYDASEDSGAWSPADLPSLAFWIDLNNLASITKDGSNNVSQVNDLSGNANHMTSSGSNRPVYSATALNSHPGITFDGTDDRMETTNGGNLILTTSPATIVVVYKNNGFPVNQYPRFISWKTQANNVGSVGYSTDIPSYGPVQIMGPTYKRGSLTAGFDTNAHAMFLTYDGVDYNQGSSWGLTIDSTVESVVTGAVIGATPAAQSYLAALSTDGGSSFIQNGAVTLSEIIFTTATLSAGDLASLRAYLTGKWGVP